MALIAALGVLAVVAAYVFVPRKADLRGFDPAALGRLESTSWRDYYDHRYADLCRCLYEINRRQYGFSPWDSGRLAFYAALAARRFQPTRSRMEAQRALPALERFYSLVRRRGGETFDPVHAARLELEWWQMRRENSTPAQYGEVVAQVSEEVYGVHDDSIREFGRLRAEMMDYRDQRRDGRMGPADWRAIERSLTRAYALLKAAVQKSAGRRMSASALGYCPPASDRKWSQHSSTTDTLP